MKMCVNQSKRRRRGRRRGRRRLQKLLELVKRMNQTGTLAVALSISGDPAGFRNKTIAEGTKPS